MPASDAVGLHSNQDEIVDGRWHLNTDNAQGGDWNAYKSRNRKPDPKALLDDPR